MATIKVSWTKLPEKVIDELMQDVKATAPKVLEAFSKEVEVSARRNFNRAINDISGDNPYISVVRTVSGNNAKITCSGEQVLYAEFGAGIRNADREVYVDCHVANRGGNTYFVEGHTKTISLTTLKDTITKQYMPRPAGIGDLGYNPMAWHTPSWGINSFWFRPSQNGRYSPTMERIKEKPNGELDPRYMFTTGTKPVRALWRARNTAINKLASGRLKFK